jgi:preprotein translocase subunit SecG
MLLGAWIFSAFLGLFITLFVIVALLLILIILIQKGRGGGLASAFGGGGGNTAFGSKTGDVLTWATSIMFGIFVLLAIILNLMTRNPAKAAVAAGGTPTQQTTPASGQGASTGSNSGTTPAPSKPAAEMPPSTAPAFTPGIGATLPPITKPSKGGATTRPSSVPAK